MVLIFNVIYDEYMNISYIIYYMNIWYYDGLHYYFHSHFGNIVESLKIRSISILLQVFSRFRQKYLVKKS